MYVHLFKDEIKPVNLKEQSSCVQQYVTVLCCFISSGFPSCVKTCVTVVEVSDHWQDFHQLVEPAWRQQRQQTVTLTKHFHAAGGKCLSPTSPRIPPGQVICSPTLRRPVRKQPAELWAPARKPPTQTHILRADAKTNCWGWCLPIRPRCEV